MNEALVTKLAGRMVTCKDAVWVKHLEDKYFYNSNPLHNEFSGNGSWIWRGITKCLLYVKKFSCWEIGNGEDVFISSGKIDGFQVSSMELDANQIEP